MKLLHQPPSHPATPGTGISKPPKALQHWVPSRNAFAFHVLSNFTWKHCIGEVRTQLVQSRAPTQNRSFFCETIYIYKNT